jgi:superfamily I DNA/RNA helicase
MKLTQEQRAVIRSSGDLCINAVAGSGKTTTIIEYAKSRPPKSRILYLAFNKSVKLEARKRFSEAGLAHVKVETAHSLAYKRIVFTHNYRVRHQGYKTHEIVKILKLRGNGEKHSELILANHISKFISYFCNSAAARVQSLNYLDTISDPKARAFVAKFERAIAQKTRLFLHMMDRGEIEITHDFYLKKFQLSAPQLPFDYLLFDEGQDASPAMLDVFLQQKATKVIVGDTHQQIYGWRHAVNSLDQVEFQNLLLSSSFRFDPSIADLAARVLAWKKHLGDHQPVRIQGLGQSKATRQKAVIARTNLGLLLRAIDLVNEKQVRKIYFEGNIHSYTYADEGASLYDVLNLHLGQPDRIRDPLIQQMNSLEDLEDYIEKTEDVQLGLMSEIVREYGREIPGILREIKDKHVGNDERDQAEVIFSTVHRCKGMEYDAVELVDDFLSEERLEKILRDNKREHLNLRQLNEEVNLLYVAITRTKNRLSIPESLLPKDFKPSERIEVRRKPKPELEQGGSGQDLMPEPARKKAYTLDGVRRTHRAAYQPWTQELDDELTEWFCEGKTIADMARHFNRSRGAIRARITKLALPETYGWPG